MACGMCRVVAISDRSGIRITAEHAVALWRCGCPSSYRPPFLRFAQSRFSAAWFGLAAAAAPAVAAVCAEDVMVADGTGRCVAFHGLLCTGLRRHLQAGKALAAPVCRDCRSSILRAESGAALHADHGNDGAALSRRDDLERTAHRRARARVEGR